MKTATDERRERAIGLETGPDGRAIGRDPRRMPAAELHQLGHRPMSPMKAIRLRCLDCCAQQADEVRKCTSVRCPSWPFRMTKNPWRETSEAQREAGRRWASQSLNRRQGLSLSEVDDADG